MTTFKPKWDFEVEDSPDSTISFEEWSHAYEDWEHNEGSEVASEWKPFLKEWQQFKQNGGESNLDLSIDSFEGGREFYNKRKNDKDCFATGIKSMKIRRLIGFVFQCLVVILWFAVVCFSLYKLDKACRQ